MTSKEFREKLNQNLDSLSCVFTASIDIDQETRNAQRSFRAKIRDIKTKIGVNLELDKLTKAWISLEKTEDNILAIGNPEAEVALFGAELIPEVRATEKANLLDVHDINATVIEQMIKLNKTSDEALAEVEINPKELSKEFLELANITKAMNISEEITNNLTDIYEKTFNIFVTYQEHLDSQKETIKAPEEQPKEVENSTGMVLYNGVPENDDESIGVPTEELIAGKTYIIDGEPFDFLGEMCYKLVGIDGVFNTKYFSNTNEFSEPKVVITEPEITIEKNEIELEEQQTEQDVTGFPFVEPDLEEQENSAVSLIEPDAFEEKQPEIQEIPIEEEVVQEPKPVVQEVKIIAEDKKGRKVTSQTPFESFGIKAVSMANLVNASTTPFKAKIALGWSIIETCRKFKLDSNIRSGSEYITFIPSIIEYGLKKLAVSEEEKKEITELLAELPNSNSTPVIKEGTEENDI